MGVAVGLAGCRATLPVEKPVFRELTQEDVTATAKKLVELRGLKLREDPKVLLQNRAAFEQSIDATYDKTENQDPGALGTLFGVVGPSTQRKPRPSEAQAAKQHVGGFYAHMDKTVRMPNTTPANRDEDSQQRRVLAHELHHVMQYQNFEMPKLAGDDAAMAWKALIEGDAQVAELLHAAELERMSASRILRRARYLVAKPAPVSPLSSPVGSTGWESLPLVAQTLREFPYRAGLAFVVDLYRAGGLELINGAYLRPPANTEQVLHPEKYLAGELPRRIGPLEPPPGWQIVQAESLGELQVRVVLEPCLGPKVALATAAGWHGDHAFALASETSMMLGWVSAWDTEADAVELEDALARMGPCLPASDSAGKRIAAPFSIRRAGPVVAFARGGEQADRSTVLDRLLALPAEAPAAVLVSTAKVPPLREPPEPTGGKLEAEQYSNEFLGLRAAISPFEARLWTPTGTTIDLLEVHPRRLRGVGQLGYSALLSPPEAMPRLFATWEERVIGWFAEDGYETTRYEELRTVETALGVGYQRSWTQRRGVLVHRVTIVPICGGSGHLTLHSKYSTNPGRELMDYWIQSFTWIDPKKRPPVCEYLDPESSAK